MWPSSLLMTVVMLAVMIPTPTISLSMPAECKVATSFNVTPTVNSQTTFWGFIKNAEFGTFLSVYFYEKKDSFPYEKIACNHTHVTTLTNNNRDNEESSTVVSWPVCSAWRQFLLEVQQETLTITDDKNNTWINTTLKSSTVQLSVIVDYFRNSCITLTPVREVQRGVPLHIATPQGSDALHFTLAGKSNTQLQVTVGSVSLPLGRLFLSQPYHRLTVKTIHGASPAVVHEGVWETVVEVGCDLSTFSLVSADSIFTLMQHNDLLLHCYKELPTVCHWSGSPFFMSVFLSGAVGFLVFVVTSCICHFKMKRSSLSKNQQKTADVSKVTNTNIRAEVKSSLYLKPLPPPTITPPKICSLSATPVYENLDDPQSSIYDEIELRAAPGTSTCLLRR